MLPVFSEKIIFKIIHDESNSSFYYNDYIVNNPLYYEVQFLEYKFINNR